MKQKAFIGASLFAAIAASLCCVLPIVFALGGFAIVGASAFFESLRSYFLIATFGMLGISFYLAYRKPKSACEPGSACARPQVNRFERIGLWIATVLVIAFAAFPYYSEPSPISSYRTAVTKPPPRSRRKRWNTSPLLSAECIVRLAP